MKEEIERVSKERMKICEGCSYHSEVRKRTGRFKTVRPDVHCTNCGCTLSAKTRCLSCTCPVNKWGAIATEEQQEELHNEFKENE